MRKNCIFCNEPTFKVRNINFFISIYILIFWFENITFSKLEEIEAQAKFTIGIDVIEALVLQSLRTAAELWLALAAGDLQVSRLNPFNDPA